MTDAPVSATSGERPPSTPSQRVYSTPELFERVASYLTIRDLAGLLLLEKAMLFRGMTCLEKWTKLPWDRHVDDLVYESKSPSRQDAGEQDHGTDSGADSARLLYRDSMRAAVRTLSIPCGHRIFGKRCAQCPITDPASIARISKLCPSLRQIDFQSISDKHPAHAKSDVNDLLSTSLHLPSRTFYITQRLSVTTNEIGTYWKILSCRASPAMADDCVERALATVRHDTRITALSIEPPSFDQANQINSEDWATLDRALAHRRTLHPPLAHLDVHISVRPSPVFKAMLATATEGGSNSTDVRLCQDGSDFIALLPAGVTPAVATKSPSILLKRPPCSPSFQFNGNKADNSAYNLRVLFRFGDWPLQLIQCGYRIEDEKRPGLLSTQTVKKYDCRPTPALSSLGQSLITMDIGSLWSALSSPEAPYRDCHTANLKLRRLAGFIDTCRTMLPALKNLALRLDISQAHQHLQDAAMPISSHSWGGSLDRLEIAFDIYSALPSFPYFAIARNMACLCHAYTSVSASITDPGPSPVYLPDWTFVRNDLGDLIRWLLSLPPAQQASVRSANFARLGLLPPVRAAHNWRDLRFFEDEPVPLDMQYLADDYKRWTAMTAAHGGTDGAGAGSADEAAKMKRRFEHVFGGDDQGWHVGISKVAKL